jgi:hypothetical protein
MSWRVCNCHGQGVNSCTTSHPRKELKWPHCPCGVCLGQGLGQDTTKRHVWWCSFFFITSVDDPHIITYHHISSHIIWIYIIVYIYIWSISDLYLIYLYLYLYLYLSIYIYISNIYIYIYLDLVTHPSIFAHFSQVPRSWGRTWRSWRSTCASATWKPHSGCWSRAA